MICTTYPTTLLLCRSSIDGCHCEPFALLRINSAKQSLTSNTMRLPRPARQASQWQLLKSYATEYYIRTKNALLVGVTVQDSRLIDVCKINETIWLRRAPPRQVVRTSGTKGLFSTLPNKFVLLCEAREGAAQSCFNNTKFNRTKRWRGIPARRTRNDCRKRRVAVKNSVLKESTVFTSKTSSGNKN